MTLTDNYRPSGPSPSGGRVELTADGSKTIPAGRSPFDGPSQLAPSFQTNLTAMTQQSAAAAAQAAVHAVFSRMSTGYDQQAQFGNAQQANQAREASRAVRASDPTVGLTKSTDLVRARSTVEQVTYGAQAQAAQAGRNAGDPTAGYVRQGPIDLNPYDVPAGGGTGGPLVPGGGGAGGGGGYGGPGGPGGARGPLQPASPNQPVPAQPVAQQSTLQSGGGGGGGGFRSKVLTNPVGAATGFVTSFASRDQWEKNRRYQEVTGESNYNGFKQRTEEEFKAIKADLNPFNPMGGDRTREAFKGATSLGMSGSDRDDAVNFISHNFKQRGMEVAETLNILAEAAKNGQTNLGTLNSALDDVSDAANKAGVNAKMARAMFQSNYQQATSQGAGQGAAAYASVVTQTAVSYGRQFQDMDAGSSMSTGFEYRFASQAGMSPHDYQATLMNGDIQKIADMRTKNAAMSLDNALGQSAIDDLKQRIAGKNLKSNPGLAASIGRAWFAAHGELDIHVLSGIATSQTGQDLSEDRVLAWVVQQYAGNTESKIAAETIASTAHTDLDGNILDENGKPTGQKAETDKNGLAGDIKKRFGRDGDWKTNLRTDRVNNGKDQHSDAGDTYVKAAEKSGTRSPVLEALLQNTEDPDDSKVEVDGRVMSLKDAIKLFPKHLEAGEAQFVSGDQKGKMVGDVAGMSKTGLDLSDEQGSAEGDKAGKDAAKWHKDNDGKSQNVVIDFTNEAKGWLKRAVGMGDKQGPPDPSQAVTGRSGTDLGY